MGHICKHFTKEWVDRYDKNVKGLAGETELYRTLCRIAEIKVYPAPVLLGEADPVVETELIARTSDYPDCYQCIDGKPFLWEMKNLCYHSQPNGWGENHQPFWQQNPEWVKRYVLNKAWAALRYPVRGSGANQRNPVTGEQECGYVRWITIPDNNMQNLTFCYASTVCSFTQLAEMEMDAFFRRNQAYADHALLNPEMIKNDGDAACAETARDELFGQVLTIITDNLPRQ